MKTNELERIQLMPLDSKSLVYCLAPGAGCSASEPTVALRGQSHNVNDRSVVR
jgi:hypothetical protein